MAPQQIGQFTIAAELAHADGGVVYRATDPKGRTVALRTMPLDVPGAAQAMAAFRSAARAASGLSSPNVAGIFGGGEAGGVFFVAVEFVEGVKLASTLARGEAMPMSEVIDLSRQVCSGLDHAHAKGILHPELKPSNIIVEWDGTAKIMDFGVPRHHPPDRITEAVYYLSPEEVRGEPLTPRSNLFSWGAMLYQMVSGHRPFNASDPETLRRKIVEEMPVEPHELNPAVPERVSEIILKALAKAPAERYGSGAELLNDLENYKNTPVAAPKPAPVPVTKTPATKAPAPARPVVEARPQPGAAAPVAPSFSAAARPAPPDATPPHKPPVDASAATAGKEPAAPTAKPAAAKAATPEARARSAAPAIPRNLLMYGMAGVIVLLLGVVLGLWLRRAPEKPQAGAQTAAPTGAATATAPAQQPAATSVPPPAAAPGRAARPKPTQAAAAPVEAPPATGGLVIDSSPQGAQVQIDGRHEASWVTPFTATGLTVGGHTVSFSMPGHAGVSRTAQVAAGQNATLAVPLAELAATIAVNSEPAGASIALDGRDTGKVTPAQLVVSKGSHSVAVRKPGYLEASSTLETSPGQTAQFSPTLKLTGSTENIKTVGKFGGIFGGSQENSGRVLVRTTPKGAQVAVNGQPVKKTTPVEFYLNPGSYEITLTLSGYPPVKKIVDVEKGGRLTVDQTFSH